MLISSEETTDLKKRTQVCTQVIVFLSNESFLDEIFTYNIRCAKKVECVVLFFLGENDVGSMFYFLLSFFFFT